MDFTEQMRQGAFCLDLRANTKDEIIREMIALMAERGLIQDTEAVYQAIIEREKKMSTGMQAGVAVPHGKSDTVEKMAVAFGLKKDGVDFDALDKQPSKIFVMTVSPTTQAGPHIQYLSQISKFLNSPSIRQKLLQAENAEEVLAILSD